MSPLCDPIDYSPLGSSVRGISQAGILEWVAILFSRGSFQPRDQTWVSYISGRFFTTEPPGKSQVLHHLEEPAKKTKKERATKCERKKKKTTRVYGATESQRRRVYKKKGVVNWR